MQRDGIAGATVGATTPRFTRETPTPSAAPPRLLLVGTHISAGGGRRSVNEDLAERLQARGWDVALTSSSLSRVGRALDMLRTTWRERRHRDVVVLDVYSGAAFAWAEAVGHLLRGAGLPYVATLRGGNLPSFAAAHARRVRRLLGGAAAVVAPSPYLARELAPHAAAIGVVPNPIALERYAYRPRAVLQPHLVWLRSMHAIYNPRLAVAVVAELAAEWPDVHLTMIGPDKDGTLARVRDDAARLGVADRLALVPGVPKADVPRSLANGDVFLNTTDVDNTPVSVLEALACGLPTVTTAVGGIPDLLRHEHDALLVPPRDAGAMAAAVRRLLRDPALAAHLSLHGRRTAEACGWDRVLGAWERLLVDVARAAPAHG